MLGKDRVVERDLLDIEKPRALQHTSHDTPPGLPVRRVVVQGEDTAIDHRVAPEPVRDTPPERLAIAFPGQGPAERFRPFVMSLIGAVDFRHDRQPAPASGRAIKLDRAPVLQPGIGVDPEIHSMAGEVPRQKRAGNLRLQGPRHARLMRKIDIPARAACVTKLELVTLKPVR